MLFRSVSQSRYDPVYPFAVACGKPQVIVPALCLCSPREDRIHLPDFSLIDVERRRYNFDEVEQTWNETVAQRQAKRCLRCDYGKGVSQKGDS